ncbi:MAG: KAP family P-loop domain-containing protein [Candidatus Kentron sp. G]|nr:MAG: KAP family P-loop domain-containing protein [Candidatus Kentron sp. G]VFM95661.1 MAG: KAP family P-loop domain-containing protein [Candidatus Kentron sp. G]VFM97384.1 MAG: KAP family P-loop domain-containing protein [Candidatus Kentron sp. G]
MDKPFDRLFDDQPKKNIKPDDLCRLDGAAHELEVLLARHIEVCRDRKDSGPKPPRVGLFGGLGQGKTSVLESVKCKLQKHFDKNKTDSRCQDNARFSNILFFDAAIYPHEELEFEFDRLISGWRFSTRATRAGFISLGLFLGFSVPTWLTIQYFYDWFHVSKNSPEASIWAVVLWAAGIAWSFWLLSLKPALDHRARKRERKANIWGLGSFCTHSLCIGIRRRPDILMVDNLDRASIEQQRAVLRGILKHSDELPMAVVVAMDETALLAAPADPESGEELLRKVIQVECRIPPRVREDIAAQILAFAKEGAYNNPHLTPLFQSSLFLGDLARIFALLPPFSPRRVKRFLNDLLIMRRQLNIADTEETIPDMSALARLQGIYDLAPTLRQLPEVLINALERNDRIYLERLVERIEKEAKGDKEEEGNARTGEETDTDVHRKVESSPLLRFLLLTRHMQPRNGVWRTLVSQGKIGQGKIGSSSLFGTERKASDPAPSMTPSERFYQAAQGYAPDYREVWQEIPCQKQGQDSDSAPANEDASRQVNAKEAKVDCVPDERWLAFELALVYAENAAQRFRLFHSWERSISTRRKTLQEKLDNTDSAEESLDLYKMEFFHLYGKTSCRSCPCDLCHSCQTRLRDNLSVRKHIREDREKAFEPLFRLYDELLFRLYRTWIADEAVLEVMGEERTRALIDRIQNNPAKEPQRLHALLFHCPANRIPFEDRLAVIANPGVLAKRDLPLVQYWLATGEHLGEARPHRVQRGADAVMLSEAWPPIARGKARDLGTIEGKKELAWHCGWLRELHRHGVPVTPESLTLQAWGRGWLENHCQRGHGANVLHGLGRLFRGEETQEKWEKAAWDAFTQDVPKEDIGKLLSAILSSGGKARIVELSQEQRETGLAMACLTGNHGLCREWLQRVEKIRNPGFMGFLLKSDGSEDNPIWREDVTDGERLVMLFGLVNNSKNREETAWKAVREQMGSRLPALLVSRHDNADILTALGLVTSMPTLPG